MQCSLPIVTTVLCMIAYYFVQLFQLLLVHESSGCAGVSTFSGCLADSESAAKSSLDVTVIEYDRKGKERGERYDDYIRSSSTSTVLPREIQLQRSYDITTPLNH